VIDAVLGSIKASLQEASASGPDLAGVGIGTPDAAASAHPSA
jgi:hypothetical protein